MARCLTRYIGPHLIPVSMSNVSLLPNELDVGRTGKNEVNLPNMTKVQQTLNNCTSMTI